ncbi:MAG: hypothetical protein PF689_03140 [Deltaproteobacteria bacterium]|jgi:hypothetical protein|nr:hypothetical protein [Deltaproteobacteria bacterium]
MIEFYEINGDMDKKNYSFAAWYPKDLIKILIFFTFMVIFNLGVYKISLFLNRPMHQLAELPSKFIFLSPLATFSLYCLQAASFLLFASFSIYILRIPKLNISRYLMGIVLLFSLPVFALNGIVLPTHKSGHYLWIYVGIISLLIISVLTFWLFYKNKVLEFRKKLFWLLIISPATLLIIARIFSGFHEETLFSDSISNNLIKFGNYLFLYQPLIWYHLLYNKKEKLPFKALIPSFFAALAIILLFANRYEMMNTVWFSGFRLTLPLGKMPELIYFISLWAGFAVILKGFLSLNKWSRAFSMLLTLYFLLGYSPFTELEILPIVLLFLMTTISLEMLKFKTPRLAEKQIRLNTLQKNFPDFDKKTQNSFFFKYLTTFTGTIDDKKVNLVCKHDKKGRISSYLIYFGNPQTKDADWVATSLALVPLKRHLFPNLPQVVSSNSKLEQSSYAVWDRNFFTDEMLDQEINDFINKNLTGEIRIWWGTGLIWESIYKPDSTERLKQIMAILSKMVEKTNLDLI